MPRGQVGRSRPTWLGLQQEGGRLRSPFAEAWGAESEGGEADAEVRFHSPVPRLALSF